MICAEASLYRRIESRLLKRKLVYTLEITVQDMVLDNHFLQITSFIFSGIFDVLMSHLYLVFLFLTLNIFL